MDSDPDVNAQFSAAVFQALAELAFFEGFFSRNGDEEELVHRAMSARANLQAAWNAMTQQAGS